MTVEQSTLDGMFKERYGEKGNLLPSSANSILADKIAFASGEKIGDSYHEPVRLGGARGWTFAGSSLAGTAYTLNAARSGVTKDASVSGSSFVLRETVAYDVVSRGAGSSASFGRIFDDIVEDMNESSILAREMSLLYGQDDFGEIEAVDDSSGTNSLTLTKASTSAGLWWQMTGAAFDAYDAAGGTKQNTNALLAVSTVDLDSQGRVVVTVTGNATDTAALAVGDVLIPLGADSEMMTGLAKVAKNTGSLYGISATTYPLWKSLSVAAGSAQATVALLLRGLKANRLKSGTGKRCALVSTATWTDLNNNTAVLQRFLNSQQKSGVEFGTEEIAVRHGKQSLEIIEHPLLKEGEAYIMDPAKHKRIGSSDHSWGIGAPGQQARFFRELPDNAGFELRCYWDQGHFARRPGSITRISGIVNSV